MRLENRILFRLLNRGWSARANAAYRSKCGAARIFRLKRGLLRPNYGFYGSQQPVAGSEAETSILIAFDHGRSASARRCLLGPFARL